MRIPRSTWILAGLMVMLWGWAIAPACMRDSPDARAVQWSTLVVQAKLSSAGRAALLPASRPDSASAWQSQSYVFQIVTVLDGTARPGDSITVVRYLRAGDTDTSICGQDLGSAQIGQSFVLLLRPEKQVAWSRRPADADPRGPELRDSTALMIVHLDSSDDLGADGLAELKQTISDTRRAEAQFKTDDARAQAHTLANAADDTEAHDAEQALLDMGVKAADAMTAEQAASDAVGRLRLGRVLDAVSVPAILDDLAPVKAGP